MSSSQGSPRRGQWSAEDPSSRYGPLVGLVVVDVQNDFADPAGSLCVKGGSEIVPLVNAEIERALEAGGAIVYTQDWHPAHTPHFAADGGIWPVHCVRETWGAAAACGAVGARADRPQGCPRRRRLLGLFDAGPGGRRSNPDGTRGRAGPRRSQANRGLRSCHGLLRQGNGRSTAGDWATKWPCLRTRFERSTSRRETARGPSTSWRPRAWS